MEGIFKITKAGIKRLALRECRNQFLRFLFVFSAVIIYSVIKNRDVEQSTIDLVINGVMAICAVGISAFVGYKIYSVFYAAYTLEVHDSSIKKWIDDNETNKSNGIMNALLRFRRNIHQNSEVFIYYRDITVIKPHRLGFLIMSAQPNEQILVPSGLENFIEIQDFVVERTKSLQN